MIRPGRRAMHVYTAVVEKCPDTGLYVGYVPGFPGAHSQGGTLEELNRNLREVIELILEDGEPHLETQFIGTQNIVVA
jgi:predicted RNase H-like HicB family nuclease